MSDNTYVSSIYRLYINVVLNCFDKGKPSLKIKEDSALSRMVVSAIACEDYIQIKYLERTGKTESMIKSEAELMEEVSKKLNVSKSEIEFSK